MGRRVEGGFFRGISPAQTELDRFPHAGQRSSVGRLKNSLLQCRELMHKDRLQFLFIKDTRFFLSLFFFLLITWRPAAELQKRNDESRRSSRNHKCRCIFSPGRSENSRMHSLKPLARSRSLSCCSMATPMQKGKEELPSSSVSHRWKILCSGNTSVCETTQHRSFFCLFFFYKCGQ